MSRPEITRRALVAGAGVAVAVAAMPGVATAPTPDVEGFLADLRTAGARLCVYWDVPRGGEMAPPAYYAVLPREGRGFGRAELEVLARWSKEMDDPDHVAAVTAHLVRLNGLER